MAKSNKRKLRIKKLRDKYRLVIINEQSYDEVFSFKLSRFQAYTVGTTFTVFIFGIAVFLIAFTGLRKFIPGYPDPSERLLIVRNAQRVDSLIVEINRRDLYINNIRTILRGEIPAQNDFSNGSGTISSTSTRPITFERSEEDSIFRKQVENEERFNLSVQQSSRTNTSLENIFFFSPIKGMVINSFGSTKYHFGVDVVAAPGSRVSAVMEGIVFFSGWTVETGYVIQIQHPNNLISIYKHNERILKRAGDVVKAGEAIARVGNSGELTSGPHLHFELWHNGTPLNPQEYITF